MQHIKYPTSNIKLLWNYQHFVPNKCNSLVSQLRTMVKLALALANHGHTTSELHSATINLQYNLCHIYLGRGARDKRQEMVQESIRGKIRRKASRLIFRSRQASSHVLTMCTSYLSVSMIWHSSLSALVTPSPCTRASS